MISAHDPSRIGCTLGHGWATDARDPAGIGSGLRSGKFFSRGLRRCFNLLINLDKRGPVRPGHVGLCETPCTIMKQFSQLGETDLSCKVTSSCSAIKIMSSSSGLISLAVVAPAKAVSFGPADPVAAVLEPLFNGHSAFQWPFCPHLRHSDSKILCQGLPLTERILALPFAFPFWGR